MEAETSISFLSLGMESLPSTSSRCTAKNAKPLRYFSALSMASSSPKSTLAAETLVSASSLSVATVTKPAENQSPESKKDGEDMGFSRNGILLFGVRISASDSDLSPSVATIDDQLAQKQKPQVKKDGKGSTFDSRNGFQLFGVWISKKKAGEQKNKRKLELQETSKPFKKRAYTPRPIKNAERAEHAPGSYKENIGELLAEKVLTRSDIDSSSRLLLSRDKVQKRLIPILNENYPQAAELCSSLVGASLQICDADTDDTYTLVLKQWVTKSFVFTGNWRKDFVKRRNLKENDEVGLFWDGTKGRFNFSVKRIRD